MTARKIILINIVLILLVLLGIELYCFKLTNDKNMKFKAQAQRLEANNANAYVTKYRLMKDFYAPRTRYFEGSNKELKPILLFGCSFAEGAGLSSEDSPCSQLTKLTGRTCYDRSKGATGTQFMYWQLLNEDFDKVTKDAGYIVYVYINNHLMRLYNYQINPLIDIFNIRYKFDRNGNLVEITPFFKPLYSLFSVKRFLNRKVVEQAVQEETDFKMFNKMMSDSAEILRKKYPGSKFIMLEYPDLSGRFLPDKEIETLESYGITVVRVKDLIGDIDLNEPQYWLSDNIHPSMQAWNIIMPEFVKRYIK